MDDCIFCKIINGEIPSPNKIYEDEHIVALLDINPVSPGHTVVVHKTHSKNILDMSDNDLSYMAVIVKKLANIVKEAVGAGGINIHVNNEPPAGQLIMHPHMHIIPRFSDDGLELWSGRPYKKGEIEKYAEQIRKMT